MVLKRPCRYCKQLFPPSGKYCTICDDCYEKSIAKSKRWLIKKAKGGEN